MTPSRYTAPMFLLFESVLAIAAFAGLFLSGFPLAQQVFFGCGLLLLVAVRDFGNVREETQFELLYRSLASGMQALERSGGNPDSYRVTDAVRNEQAKVTQHSGDMHFHGGTFHVLKYAFWVVGGYMAAYRFVPFLLQYWREM
jgi:hypothetical protein